MSRYGSWSPHRRRFAQSADRAADEAAVRAVIQAFLDTREKNDAAGLAALLTPDVDQRQTSGNMRSGRDAVVSGSLATQQSTGGRRTITVDSLRFVGARRRDRRRPLRQRRPRRRHRPAHADLDGAAPRRRRVEDRRDPQHAAAAPPALKPFRPFAFSRSAAAMIAHADPGPVRSPAAAPIRRPARDAGGYHGAWKASPFAISMRTTPI